MMIISKLLLLLFALGISFVVKADELEVTTFSELMGSLSGDNTIIIQNDIIIIEVLR